MGAWHIWESWGSDLGTYTFYSICSRIKYIISTTGARVLLRSAPGTALITRTSPVQRPVTHLFYEQEGTSYSSSGNVLYDILQSANQYFRGLNNSQVISDYIHELINTSLFLVLREQEVLVPIFHPSGKGISLVSCHPNATRNNNKPQGLNTRLARLSAMQSMQSMLLQISTQYHTFSPSRSRVSPTSSEDAAASSSGKVI